MKYNRGVSEIIFSAFVFFVNVEFSFSLTDVNVAILVPDEYDNNDLNKFSNSSFSNISILESYYDYEISISNCKPGHFLTLNSTTALPCPSGTFNPCEGKTFSCTACPLNSYSTSEGLRCTLCPNGTFTVQNGSKHAEQCLACPAGHYCLPFFEPVPCPSGTYNQIPGQCAACPIGTFADNVQGRQGVCPPCPANSVCANPNTITTCPERTVSPEGSISLLDCKCLAGYECAYRRQILVRMSFANNNSGLDQESVISQLQNNTGLIEKL